MDPKPTSLPDVGTSPLASLLRRLGLLMPMRHNTRGQYLLVTLLMLLALGARLLIAPVEGGIQYVTFFPLVAVAAVIGGFWVGIYAALLGVVAASYLFWPPYMQWVFEFRQQTVLSNAVFLIDALLVCTSIEAMHRFYRRAISAREELRLAATVFEHTLEGIMVTDAHSRILSINPAFTAITGYSEEEVIGETPAILRSQRHDAEFYRDMWRELSEKGQWRGEVWNRRKNGEIFLESLTISSTGESGEHERYVGVFRDITDIHLKDKHVRYLAFHDALTDLPNRMLLQDRLEHAIARAERKKEILGLLYLDLDRFKGVNDELGHEIGDLLLQEVAGRIRETLRVSDTAARLGGDEFVILLEGQRPGERCPRLAQRLIEGLSQPFQLKGKEVCIGASIGIAYYPDNALDLDGLLHEADRAMYAAKSAGRDTFRFSDGHSENGEGPAS